MFRVVLVCAAGLFFTGNLYARVTITGVKGSLPRDLTANYFDVELTLSGISKEKSGTERYAHRLEIYIEELNSTTFIPFADIGPEANKPLVNMLIEYSKDEVVTKASNLTDAVIYLRFKPSNSKTLTDIVDKKKLLTLTIDYKGDATDGEVTLKGQKIEREAGVAKEAPTDVALKGTFKAVTATFAKKDKIAFSAGGDKAPTGVALFVMRKGADDGSITVDALVHDPEADSDTEETTCTIDTDASEGSQCVTCAKGNSYIQRGSIPATITVETSTDLETISLSGLPEADEDGTVIEYLAFLTYQPDGLAQSTCHYATPVRNFTWSELEDADEQAKRKDPRCFIATATFGSPAHKHVETFRSFRDQYLMPSWLGQLLVEAYYVVSPPLAWLVERSPTLKSLSLKVLEPLAEYIEKH